MYHKMKFIFPGIFFTAVAFAVPFLALMITTIQVEDFICPLGILLLYQWLLHRYGSD
jgi:hypothetical protein